MVQIFFNGKWRGDDYGLEKAIEQTILELEYVTTGYSNWYEPITLVDPT